MISDNLGLLLFYNPQELYDDDALAAQGCLHIIANLIGLPFLLKLETAVMIPIHSEFHTRCTLFSHIFSKYFILKGFSHVLLLSDFSFSLCYQKRSHFILAVTQKYVLCEPRIAAPYKVSVSKSFFTHQPSLFHSLPGLISAHYSPLSTLSSPLSSILL